MSTHKKVVVVLLLMVASGVSIYSFLYTRKVARAYSLDKVIIEPAEPQEAQKNDRSIEVDSRIADFKDRGDGARLFLAPAEEEVFTHIAFSDNSTIVISATTTREDKIIGRVFSLGLEGKKLHNYFESENEMVASNYRPAHKNADVFCYSEKIKNVFEIVCVPYDGGEAENVTEHDGNEYLMEPAISPDGNWIAFQVDTSHKKNPEGSSIWKIGMNRSGIKQLTRGADDKYPTWSSDGKELLFQRRLSDGNWDIYRMKHDGAYPEPVLRTYDENEMWPVMINDLELIAAVGLLEEPTRIKKLNTFTKAGTWLTSGEYGNETNPTVSPDGKLVSFLAPVDPAEPERLGIWILQL